MKSNEGALVSAMQRYPHLKKYIDHHVKNTGKKPVYLLQLTRELEDAEFPDFLYPVEGPIFVHTYQAQGELIKYMVIQPELTKEEKRLYKTIVDSLVLLGLTRTDEPRSLDELRTMLNEHMDELMIVGETAKSLKTALASISPIKRIVVDPLQNENLRYHIINNLTGLGKIEPLMRDPWIEDISCTGLGAIFIIHKIFKSIETNIFFKNDDELDEMALKISEKSLKPVTDSSPICDGSLPDGSRVNVLYTRDISKKGSSFSIRKFSAEPISITRLVEWNTITSQMAAYLWLCVEYGMSIFICGESACGKTSTLNALTGFIPAQAKVFSVEDTPEVLVPQECWQRLLTRSGSGKKGHNGVEMFDLLKAALRSRPNYIIPGEIRGEEGFVAFQGIQTGHPVVSTFHASSVKAMLQRLTGRPINIPLSTIDNLNVSVIQQGIRRGRKIIRRVIELSEIERYSPEANGILTRSMFEWNPVNDSFTFKGMFNSFILEQKLAPVMGFEDIREIYAEMNFRAKVIDEMVKRGIFDFFKTAEIFSLYHEFGAKGLPFGVSGG
ncbi:type IV secretion system protein VirB11 [archaeon BMS3Abin16]|nr:type IV secretion system protein VirB11 [archaeon BMS3Abin16]HDY74717.1 hypothetical protein [Euryarchaeota archaeon]